MKMSFSRTCANLFCSRSSSRLLREIAIGAAASLLALVAGGACGEDAAAPNKDPVPVIREPTDTTVVWPAGAQARADRIVVRPGDLPAGWAAGGDPVDADDDLDDRIERCLAMAEDEGPSAESELHNGTAAVIAATAVLRPSREAAEREFKLLAGEGAKTCLERTVAEFPFPLPDGAEVTEAVVANAAYAPIGDGLVSYRVTATATSGGASSRVVADLLFFYVDEVRLLVAAFSASHQVDTVVVANAARLMADRVRGH